MKVRLWGFFGRKNHLWRRDVEMSVVPTVGWFVSLAIPGEDRDCDQDFLVVRLSWNERHPDRIECELTAHIHDGAPKDEEIPEAILRDLGFEEV